MMIHIMDCGYADKILFFTLFSNQKMQTLINCFWLATEKNPPFFGGILDMGVKEKF